jgi:radical SAM superfamily enzyme YgiQ (UPF0313 family)
MSDTRILFVYSNINGFHSDTYSFGLASIVAIAREQGCEVRMMIIESREEYPALTEKLNDFKPNVVGFTSVSSQFHFVKELCQLIKKFDEKIITICGGVHPTINPECVKESMDLDAVFMGESERAFIEFLERIKKGDTFTDINNIAYVQNGKAIRNPLNEVEQDLDTFPAPDRTIYPFQETLTKTGFTPFLFSRGCPFSCSYCSNHAIAKMYGCKFNKPRYRSPELSIQEIEEVIKNYEVDRIMITDDLFGLNKTWRKEFCEKYAKRIKKPFLCLLRANVVDEEFISLLKNAGCYRVMMGIESGNDYIRNKVMKRRMSREVILRAFHLANQYKIQTNALNIIGVPQETEETIWDTIKLNRESKATTTVVNIFYPYKGTELGDYCFENNLVDIEAYNDFSNERRDSVLHFQNDFKERLRYFQENWEAVVFPYNFRKAFLRQARRTKTWSQLGKIKRKVLSFAQKTE